MKSMKSVAVACALAFFATVVAQAGPGACCKKAEKAGKACTHECCVSAAKEGKNCTKCGGSGDLEKKEDKKKEEKK